MMPRVPSWFGLFDTFVFRALERRQERARDLQALARMVGIANAHSPVPPAPTTMLARLDGVVVVPSAHIPDGEWVHFRFPRSKRKRIRQKWAKNPDNYRWVREPKFFQMGSTIYANACGYEALQRLIPEHTRPGLPGLDDVVSPDDYRRMP